MDGDTLGSNLREEQQQHLDATERSVCRHSPQECSVTALWLHGMKSGRQIQATQLLAPSTTLRGALSQYKGRSALTVHPLSSCKKLLLRPCVTVASCNCLRQQRERLEGRLHACLRASSHTCRCSAARRALEYPGLTVMTPVAKFTPACPNSSVAASVTSAVAQMLTSLPRPGRATLPFPNRKKASIRP